MAFDKTALLDYVEQNRSDLAAAAVMAPTLAKRATLMPDVVGQTTINNADVTIAFQSGAACGWNASGNDKFSQRMLTPGLMKVNKNYCHKDVLGTFASHEARIKAGFEKMPFEEFFMDENTKKIAFELEKALFSGDKSNGTGNLAFFDGLHTIIGKDITNNVITSGQVLTAGNGDSVLKRTRAVLLNIPEEVLDDVEIWMSIGNYRQFIEDCIAANNYHFFGELDSTFETTLPGTSIKVVGMPGMRGINDILAVVPKEIYYGFNEADSATTYDFWFSKDNDEFRFKSVFTAGIQYRFPQHIIVGKPYGGQ